MDAHVMRGGAPAARGEDASQEQDRVEQDGDMDGDQDPAGSRTRQIRGAGQIRAICSMRPSQCRFTDRHYQSPRKLISGLCSSSQSAGADLRSQKGLWAAQLRRACNSAPWSGCQQDQD